MCPIIPLPGDAAFLSRETDFLCSPRIGGRTVNAMRSTAAVISVAAGLTFVAGCGDGSVPPSAPVAAPATTVTVAVVPPTAPQGATTVTVAAPAPAPAPAPAEAAPAAPTSGTSPSQAQFWQLIAETRSAAENNTGRQSELLKERLTHLSPAQIVDFARIRHQLDQAAYTYDLWGAAYVIEDGCSDDCFRDFRGYLISLGQGPYEAALRDPDSLAPVAQDAEQGDWENADNVAPDAYSSVTSNDFPLDTSDLSGTPRGTPFDDNNIASLVRRFPRLAARFR